MVAAPALIGCDEFPVGYSLAGCPPAEPASASPTGDDSQQSTLPYNDFSANGNYPLNFVSQSKGALQSDPPPYADFAQSRFWNNPESALGDLGLADTSRRFYSTSKFVLA